MLSSREPLEDMGRDREKSASKSSKKAKKAKPEETQTSTQLNEIEESKPKKIKPKASERKKRALEKKRAMETGPRDFIADLNEYLAQWEEKEGWKFNKVLQSWALDSCLGEEKVGAELFSRLLPYIESVRGGQRDRLLENCQKSLSDFDELSEGEKEQGGESLLTQIARAKVLIKVLS